MEQHEFPQNMCSGSSLCSLRWSSQEKTKNVYANTFCLAWFVVIAVCFSVYCFHCLSMLFPLAIVFSVLRYTASDYPFGIFNVFPSIRPWTDLSKPKLSLKENM